MESPMASGARLSPLERFIRALEDGGYRPRKIGGGEWQARCPGHGGKDYDSLTFRETEDGKTVLMWCHSRHCTPQEILEPLGLELSDLYDKDPVKEFGLEALPGKIRPRKSRLLAEMEGGSREPEAVYSYTDEEGKTLYQVLRYRTEEGKTFRQRRPSGTGWEWKLGDVRRVLYRLPEVTRAVRNGQTVFVVEGEKDADNLAALGLVATCAMGGAISKPSSWLEEWSETLRGARVIILPDNDLPGKTHGSIVGEALASYAKSVRTVELRGLPLRGDVSDYLENHSKEELLEAVQKTRLTPIQIEDLVDSDIPENRLLLRPWLRERDLVMVHAWRGVGKTHFSLGLAVAVATGTAFLGWKAPEPVGVLYIDGEMSLRALQMRAAQRLLAIGRISGEEGPPIPLHFVTADMEEEGIRRLDTVEGQQDIEELLERFPSIKFVVIDNLSCLTWGAENDPELWEPMKVFTLRLRRAGKTVLMVHHSGKGGAQRGTSKREDQLNTVIHLDRPPDYQPQDGARFKILFQKARDLHGAEIPELEAQLVETPEGPMDWAIKTLEQSKHETVARFFNEGRSVSQIATLMGLAVSTVSDHLRRADGKGLLTRDWGKK